MHTFSKLLILSLFVTVARSEILHISNIQLDGFQPATPTLSPATGIASMTINTETRFVEISGSFEGLLAPASMAHLHGPADFGEPSPLIILPLTVTADTSGSFSAGRVVSQSIYATILSSLSYINIHTPAHPTGEIRGQVVVPSPATAGLFILLPALASRRSRR